jgi:hypothetical protein
VEFSLLSLVEIGYKGVLITKGGGLNTEDHQLRLERDAKGLIKV